MHVYYGFVKELNELHDRIRQPFSFCNWYYVICILEFRVCIFMHTASAGKLYVKEHSKIIVSDEEVEIYISDIMALWFDIV